MVRTLSERMAEAARSLRNQDDSQATLDEAAQLAVREIDGVDAAAISIVHEGHRVDTQATTGELASVGDRLQYETHEGPCLDAAAGERVVHSAELRTDQRWPTWGPRVAAEAGAHSILAFRLFTNEHTIGALNLYARLPRAFDATDLDDGLAIAAHIAVALGAAEQIQGLTAALDSRTVISQAVGIVMERYEVTAPVAFSLLSRISQTSNTRLRAIAEELIETGAVHGVEPR